MVPQEIFSPSSDGVFTVQCSEKHIYVLWSMWTRMQKSSTGGARGEVDQKTDRTVGLIEALYAKGKRNVLILNPEYLDDEQLPGEERAAVLKEIFNRHIREPQLARIAQHLTPILDGGHPPAALVYGPTGSGKTVSLLHLLSSFERVCANRRVPFKYFYVDLTSPKTYFGALNEVALALDDSG